MLAYKLLPPQDGEKNDQKAETAHNKIGQRHVVVSLLTTRQNQDFVWVSPIEHESRVDPTL